MSVINTNYLSLVAQNNLQKSQSALGSAIERLSSGLRINSAKDDAAGQAIANRMTSQVNGLNQAQRNANDGISVAQTAEGALNQVNDNLQRIRELSVQAQNDTNSADDRASIQAEIDQRLTEIDRISRETDFNGVKVLDTDNALKIQVGANDGEVIEINLDVINSEELGLDGFSVSGLTYVGVAAATDGSLAVDGVTYDTGGTPGDTEVTSLTFEDADGGALAGFSLLDDGAGNYFITDGTDYYEASVVGTVGTAGDGSDTSIVVTQGALVTSPTTDATAAATADPLATLDSAIKMVDTLRSDLGAIQNRFESAITNLQTNSTNLTAARSRIEDADYAVEVANMSKNQILQQAGTSVLAQANQIPQGVLSLLR